MKLLLLLVCAAVGVSWYLGHVPGWAAIVAFLVGVKIFAVMARARHTKAWEKQWQAMREEETRPAASSPASMPAGRRSRRRIFRALPVTLALSAVLLIPALVSLAPPAPVHDWGGGVTYTPLPAPHVAEWRAVWWSALLYLVFALVRVLWRRLKKSKPVAVDGTRDTQADGFVSCLVRRPAVSPSRLDASRDLPEYAAALLSSHESEAKAG